MKNSTRNEPIKRVTNPMKRFMVGSRKIIMCVVLLSLFLVSTLFPGSPVYAQCGDCQPIGAHPLSHNWYRVPLDLDVSGGESVRVHSNNVRQNGHNGADMFGRPSLDDSNDSNDMNDSDVGYRLVAAADGIVRRVTDENCCRRPPGADPAVYPNNCVWIEHANGEWTAYYHVAQNSAQVNEGDPVSAGDYIADEGEVGAASGVHLHFAVYYGFDGTVPKNEVTPVNFKGQRIPLICGIRNNIFEVSERYSDGTDDDGAIEPCDPTTCFNGSGMGGQTIANGEIEVEQASDTVTAQNYTIQSGASVAFRAGDSITLRPGFRARTGSYFHAQIGPCNTSTN